MSEDSLGPHPLVPSSNITGPYIDSNLSSTKIIGVTLAQALTLIEPQAAHLSIRDNNHYYEAVQGLSHIGLSTEVVGGPVPPLWAVLLFHTVQGPHLPWATTELYLEKKDGSKCFIR